MKDLLTHQLLGFSQLDAHNVWPVWQREGEFLRIKPTLCASSGETLRQLALAGGHCAAIGFCQPRGSRQRLVQVLENDTRELRCRFTRCTIATSRSVPASPVFWIFTEKIQENHLL